MIYQINVAFLLLVGLVLALGEECGSEYGLLPGIQRMARGVDLTRLDLTVISADDGFRNTLIDFTCKRGRLWSQPESDDTKWWWPDQVAGVNSVPGGTLLVTTTISEDTVEFKDSMKGKVTFAVEGGLGSFSSSVSVKKAEESKFKTKAIFAVVITLHLFKITKL